MTPKQSNRSRSPAPGSAEALTPIDHYRREKARRLAARHSEKADPLEAAREDEEA